MMTRILFSVTFTMLLVATGYSQRNRDRVAVPSGDLINDLDQAAVALHPATPFIEQSTFVVLDVDIEKIDVRKSAEWILKLMGSPDENMTVRSAAMAGGFLDSLKAAGVKHVFLTASTRSLMDGGPLLIVPCQNPAVVKGLASVVVQMAPKETPQKIHVAEELVLVGATAAIDRVLATPGSERADLILPLKDPDRLDHTIVIALPDEASKELSAFWPDRLPNDAPFQFSPRGMMEDIRRVVVSFRLPPEPRVHARIETRDVKAAARVITVVKNVIALSPQAEQAVSIEADIEDVILEMSPDTLAKVIADVTAPARRRAGQQVTMNSLKQIGLAMHNYYGVEKHLPPRSLTDRDGKALLSWRVTLLPYLEQLALYNRFKLGQPWDGEDNKRLGQLAITGLTEGGSKPNQTRFRAPVYPGSLWDGEGDPKTFQDVIDGTSRTIAAIHAPADAAVEWSNPEPWVLSIEDPASTVFGDRDRVTVLLLDGSARVFTKDQLDNEKLKAMLTYAGREAFKW